MSLMDAFAAYEVTYSPPCKGGQGGITSAQMNPPLTPPLQGGEQGYFKPLPVTVIIIIKSIFTNFGVKGVKDNTNAIDFTQIQNLFMESHLSWQ
jgi:hypothetical protein